MQTEIENTSYRYKINEFDRISFVDASWVRFSVENDASDLTLESIAGTSIWDFFSGTETRYLYEHLYSAVRTSGKRVELPFRCDGSAIRRYMSLSIALEQDGGLIHTSTLIRTEPRSEIEIFNIDTRNREDLLTMCSWCNRIELDSNSWVDVEVAVEKLDLFHSTHIPGISHGICNECASRIHDVTYHND
jgi:hypothetical protein